MSDRTWSFVRAVFRGIAVAAQIVADSLEPTMEDQNGANQEQESSTEDQNGTNQAQEISTEDQNEMNHAQESSTEDQNGMNPKQDTRAQSSSTASSSTSTAIPENRRIVTVGDVYRQRPRRPTTISPPTTTTTPTTRPPPPPLPVDHDLEETDNEPPPEPKTWHCHLCGKIMICKKAGRGGFFLGCPAYPSCRGTRNMKDPNKTGPKRGGNKMLPTVNQDQVEV